MYDPTIGDDSANFLGIDPALACASLRRVNEAIARAAARHGTLVDLHAHFLRGDPSWFFNTIEPSPRGASEFRARFPPASSRPDLPWIRRPDRERPGLEPEGEP